MDEGSKRKKKKRGKSLIFIKCFHLPSSRNRGKVLASDDNLIYCDANGNCEPEIKKSTSSRGRVSRAFKAVLFDAAMKKKMGRKKSSKPLYESENSSPVREDETEIIDNLFTENDMNITKEGTLIDSENSSPVRDEKPDKIEKSSNEDISNDAEDKSNDTKKLETGDSSNGSSNVISMSSNENNSNDAKKLETGSSSNDSSNVTPKSSKENDSSDESQMASSSTSSINVDSQILTERKVTARVNSMKKKPPLPSKSRTSAKTNLASDSNHGISDNATYHWCLLVLLAVFILVVFWMS